MTPSNKSEYPKRINVYLRDKGLASRREADELITRGKVKINGKKAQLGDLVMSPQDNVELFSTAKEIRYVAYYKPVGAVTHTAQYGEKDVAEIFKKQGLYPIGRLDKDSEGLLLLTNDRLSTDKIIGENNALEKEYVVSVRETLRPGLIPIFARGMETENLGTLKPAEAHIVDEHTLRIVLHEGKKHQIRVMLAELKYTVIKLKRVRIGNIKLGKLFPNQIREIVGKELQDFQNLMSR